MLHQTLPVDIRDVLAKQWSHASPIKTKTCYSWFDIGQIGITTSSRYNAHTEYIWLALGCSFSFANIFSLRVKTLRFVCTFQRHVYNTHLFRRSNRYESGSRLVHLFVCFVRVSFCIFSLPLGVGGWLRFVIVALPGRFFLLFFPENEILLKAGGYITLSNHHVIKSFSPKTVFTIIKMLWEWFVTPTDSL